MAVGHGIADGEGRGIVFASLTVSDSRSAKDDASAPLIKERVEGASYRYAGAWYARDEVGEIAGAFDQILAHADVRVIVVTGGTGFSPRDVTVDALEGRFERQIPGFGEIFRRLSFDEIGAAAMLSRASAGVIGGRSVFLLPGSPKAVELALHHLILPVAAHLAGLLGLAQEP